MTEPSHFDRADRARLGRALTELGMEAPHTWTPEEIEAIYRHELAAPVQIELGTLGDAAAARLRLTGSTSGLLLNSIGSLLHHPEPPVELLVMLKDFAKAMMDHPDSALPREVAGVIYWTCIATALVRRAQRITTQDGAKLLAGFAWALGRPWIDPQSAELLRAARANVAAAGEATGEATKP